MEQDHVFEKMKPWHDMADLTGDRLLAFQYLARKVERIFREFSYGVPLVQISEFLKAHDVEEDMMKALGFANIPHFLFHLHAYLELRSKKINGRIFYFLFAKNNCGHKGNRRITNLEVDEYKNQYVHRDSAVPSEFYKVLSIHRASYIPLKTIKDPTLPTRSRYKNKVTSLPDNDLWLGQIYDATFPIFRSNNS